MTRTDHLFRFMLAAQSKDVPPGHIEVDCPECDGTGWAEYERIDRPWRVITRECENCHGRGTIWIEGGNDD